MGNTLYGSTAYHATNGTIEVDPTRYRYMGSLSTGTDRAHELVRVHQGGGKPTPLGHRSGARPRREDSAPAQLRRQRHLPALDRRAHQPPRGPPLRRRIIFHGNRGELRQPYREGQEDRLAALGFALNVLVLWNTQYMHDAVNHLRRNGRINDEHVARLAATARTVLMLRTFPFTLPRELAADQRRQLRIGEASA